MATGIDELARAVRAAFKTQRMQADADKERFGDWNTRLAKLIRDSVADLYLEAAKGAKAKAELGPGFAALAKMRALEVARQINETTSIWLQDGREPDVVFSDARVTMIAATEAAHARAGGIMLVAKMAKKKLVWVVGRKPCAFCRSLKGKTRKPGQSFGIHKGVSVTQPPVHPHCYCKLRIE